MKITVWIMVIGAIIAALIMGCWDIALKTKKANEKEMYETV